MSYDNTNRGAIWGNDRKEKDTHPDFKGEANIDGTDYWVSAWKRKPDANPKAPALSFSFTRKEAAPAAKFVDGPRYGPSDNFTDEDIPL